MLNIIKQFAIKLLSTYIVNKLTHPDFKNKLKNDVCDKIKLTFVSEDKKEQLFDLITETTADMLIKKK